MQAPIEALTFALGKEEYALDIQRVQELRSYETVTHIANAPDHIKGVVNLRGTIVPILDLRIKFGQSHPSYDGFTVVVVLNVRGKTVGAVVDSVADVVTLQAGQIKPAPQIGTSAEANCIVGLGTLGERMLILLDIEKLTASLDVCEAGELQPA